MKQPEISVIVPVYNAGKYLRRCVDSILAQTFTDFELLLINDGSTDSSPAICDQYASADSRVRVFHKPNGGVSSARNLGLDNARGQWIAFVDADDYVDNGYLKSILPNENEFVIGSMIWESSKDSIKTSFVPKTYDYNEIIPFLERNISVQMFTGPCFKLYLRRLLVEHDIKFERNLQHNEDFVFVLRYLCTQKFYIRTISECYYHYQRDIEQSLSVKHVSYENNFRFLDMMHTYIDYIYRLYDYDKIPYYIFREHTANCFMHLIKSILHGYESVPRRIIKLHEILQDSRIRNLLLDTNYVYRDGHKTLSRVVVRLLCRVYYFPHELEIYKKLSYD